MRARWLCRVLDGRAGAELAVEIQQRGGIVADHLELGDDLARGLLLLHLLGQEPLELRDGRERLLVEGDFVEAVDLPADLLLLLERAFEAALRPVADAGYSVITEQVTNGVAVRMALLFLLLGQGSGFGVQGSGERS